MPPAPRRASTPASTGARVARATRSSRARSPGLAAGSRPTLDSPQTTRPGRWWPPASSRLAASLARKRGSTAWTTPGCARATFTATSRKLTAQTPPRAARASTGGLFHWLAPSRPHGPPSACQERTYSPPTNALGSSSSAAAGPARPRPASSRLASQPSGSHRAASSSASGTMNGPTFGHRKASTARKNPPPPSHARTAPSRGVGAARASSSSGTSPAKASHHSPGRGKASASGAPATRAAARPPQRPGPGTRPGTPAVGGRRGRRLVGAAAITPPPSEVHRHVLDLEELVDALGAALAAEAGLLDPAERRRRVGDHALVEPDHAGLQALHHPERPPQVAGVDVGDQAELGVVGGRDGGLLVVEGRHRGDRAEDLLLEHARVPRHVGEHGRLVEVAAAVAGPGADHRAGAPVEGVADQLGDLGDRVLVDQRAGLPAPPRAPADPP